jgi:hypothetical protein
MHFKRRDAKEQGRGKMQGRVFKDVIPAKAGTARITPSPPNPPLEGEGFTLQRFP